MDVCDESSIHTTRLWGNRRWRCTQSTPCFSNFFTLFYIYLYALVCSPTTLLWITPKPLWFQSISYIFIWILLKFPFIFLLLSVLTCQVWTLSGCRHAFGLNNLWNGGLTWGPLSLRLSCLNVTTLFIFLALIYVQLFYIYFLNFNYWVFHQISTAYEKVM